MRIGVMGAGAVGCYYGAMLAKAGHDVTLVGRSAFVEHVKAHGLTLEMAGGEQIIRLAASTEPGALADADIVIFSVKSTDTEEAGRSLAPHLKAGATVFTFQNGVDNDERLAAILGRPVVPAVVYVATNMPATGHVRHNGRGEIIIGPSVESEHIAEVFRAAGIDVTVSDTVREALWAKLIVNCAYNALCAVSQVPYGPMVAVDGVTDVMANLVDECIAVGRWLGVDISDPDLDAILNIARTMPGQFSSTAQDMARGKETEIDYLNGYIVRQGKALGIPTPTNQALYVMVKLLETKRA